jgi:hypothetical protein
VGAADLEPSGGLIIDRLIEEEFVGQSLAVKSRSIARAAAAVAGSLARRYNEAQSAEDEATARHERATALLVDALRRCEAEPAQVAARIGVHLHQAHARWRSEAALVFDGGGTGPAIWRARYAHAEGFLAGPLGRAFAEAMAPAVEEPGLLQLLARTIAQGCAVSMPDLQALSFSAVAGLTGLLRMRATPRASRSEIVRQSREIAAIVGALEMGRARAAGGGTL